MIISFSSHRKLIHQPWPISDQFFWMQWDWFLFSQSIALVMLIYNHYLLFRNPANPNPNLNPFTQPHRLVWFLAHTNLCSLIFYQLPTLRFSHSQTAMLLCMQGLHTSCSLCLQCFSLIFIFWPLQFILCFLLGFSSFLYLKIFIFLPFWIQLKCFWTVVLVKTLDSPLDCKKIQPVHPKGDQS